MLNTSSGEIETLWVTPSHPIYVKGIGWTPVGQMDRAGDVLENYRFGNSMVYRCYQNVDVGRVYNFEVEEFHTYYVGKVGIWVRNQCEEKNRLDLGLI